MSPPHAPLPPAYEVDWSAIGSIVFLLLVFGAITVAILLHQKSQAKWRLERQAAEKARWDYLVRSFGADVAGRILKRMIWQGQTLAMLHESRGRPVAIDQEVLKTKTREVLKYEQVARNRFRLKITMEDGVVVGWDQKAG